MSKNDQMNLIYIQKRDQIAALNIKSYKAEFGKIVIRCQVIKHAYILSLQTELTILRKYH